jgi:hypothetical protein
MRALLWLRNSLNGLLIIGSLLAIPLSLLNGDGLLMGVALCFGYLMPWFGGMGMRGAFKTGTSSQKVAGALLGIVFLVVGTWLLMVHPYSAQSWLWGPGLFAWGFLTVSNSDTAERGTVGDQPPAPNEQAQQLASLPQGTLDIIAAYGAVLEAVSTGPEHHAVYPQSKLPYPKPVIETAFKVALAAVTDPQLRDQLQVGLTFLDDFLPDNQVANDPREQAVAIAQSTGGRHAGAA